MSEVDQQPTLPASNPVDVSPEEVAHLVWMMERRADTTSQLLPPEYAEEIYRALRELQRRRSSDETSARQKYSVTGHFVPLSENGVMQVGMLGIVNIPETTHAVYLYDEEFPEKAPGDPYKATCEGGTGGPCTQPDCEKCWDDEGRAVNGREDRGHE